MPPRKRKIDLGAKMEENKNEEDLAGPSAISAPKTNKKSQQKSPAVKKARKKKELKMEMSSEESDIGEGDGGREEELKFKPYAIYREGQLNLMELEGKKGKEIRRAWKEAKKWTTIYVANEPNGRKIVPFFGGASSFSNFHASAFQVAQRQFCCSEQFYHFCKAVAFDDLEAAEKILETNKPGEMKRIGRRVQGFDRAVWGRLSVLAMVIALMQKFQQNEALKGELTATNGAELIEASPFDGIWGTKKSARKILSGEKWNGKNQLGRTLMAIRSHLLGPDFSGESGGGGKEGNQEEQIIIGESAIHKFANEEEIRLANKLVREFKI